MSYDYDSDKLRHPKNRCRNCGSSDVFVLGSHILGVYKCNVCSDISPVIDLISDLAIPLNQVYKKRCR